MQLYKNLMRPLLFTLEPETAWHLSDLGLSQTWFWKIMGRGFQHHNEFLGATVAGIPIKNPVGLAAGYDKNCRFLLSLEELGFGYVMGGTITKDPRPGNPKPRVIRLKEQSALINALGFPGDGLERVLLEISKMTSVPKKSVRIISVSGTDIPDIAECHQQLEPFCDAIELNISSPNTKGLRIFQEPTKLRSLLAEVNQSRSKPLLVKMPPYKSENGNDEKTLNLGRICLEEKVESLTVSNTIPIQHDGLAVGQGGLSGSPLFENTIAMVETYQAEFGDKIEINACGGISNGYQAYEALKSGASSIQILTSLIYEGPRVVQSINKELSALFTNRGDPRN